MKNNNEKPPINTATRRTYKPRTPMTKIHLKIMNDPFIRTV